jgi:hypothetical protein
MAHSQLEGDGVVEWWEPEQDGWAGATQMNAIVWNKLVLGGWSQGNGHAALIGLEQEVSGLFLLDGPLDSCMNGATPQLSDWPFDITNQSPNAGAFGAYRSDKPEGWPDPWAVFGLDEPAQDWDATVGAGLGRHRRRRTGTPPSRLLNLAGRRAAFRF